MIEMKIFSKLVVLFLVISSIVIATNGASVGIDSRIVGGDEAVNGAFPYQVSLRQRHRHLCGGTIISVLYVITAAHCVPSLPVSEATVISGSNSLARGGETHGVSKITSHPDYVGSSDNWRYDIAIITLAAELTVTILQSPIPVATSDPPEGAETVVSGWGRFLYDSNSTPTKLQYYNPVIVDIRICQTTLFSGFTDRHLCAVKAEGSGVCSGDSGGPMVYNGELVGIVSIGLPPCGTGVPDGYTRVPVMIDFIETVTGLSWSK